MRHLIACCLLIGTVVTALPATAAKRVALVIGNSAYENAPFLPNPVNDARAVADALRRLDFVVIEAVDQDEAGMQGLLGQFYGELQDADASLFFYAGHGLQVRGQNYLVPVDAALRSEVDLPFEAVSVEVVLDLMEQTTPLRLMFLDACRDNPLARSLSSAARGGASRGLARMDNRAGTLIAFATEPDKVALDGDGEHSPFALALLEHIETPGLEVRQMLSRVRATVIANTDGEQLPLDTSALVEDFYFTPPAPPAPPPPAPVAAAPAPVAAAPAPWGVASNEQLFWQSIQTSTDPNDFRAYLESYPGGAFVRLARNRLNVLGGASQKEVAALTPPTETPPAGIPRAASSAPQTEIAALTPPTEAPAATPPAAPPVPPVAESIEVEPMDATVVATRNVNVRAAPNTVGDPLGVVTQGTEVAVVGKVIGADWYQIERPDGGRAYVHAPLFVRPSRSTAAADQPAAAPAPVQAAPAPQPPEPAQVTYAAPSTIYDPAPAGIERPAATKEPSIRGPVALFESGDAEESLTRRAADADAEKRLPTEETKQPTQNKKAEVTANTVHAKLEQEPRKEASPEKMHQIDLAKITDRSECEAFLDSVYEKGLRDNASRFQTCLNEHEGRQIVFYQQPGCTDPVWSQMEGPKKCRPLVEYACEVFRRKSDFLAKCDEQLAKR
jgi:uncharacterized caspase-like protein/uncharacterized protein YgiM (DUF1202 family)